MPNLPAVVTFSCESVLWFGSGLLRFPYRLLFGVCCWLGVGDLAKGLGVHGCQKLFVLALSGDELFDFVQTRILFAGECQLALDLNG